MKSPSASKPQELPRNLSLPNPPFGVGLSPSRITMQDVTQLHALPLTASPPPKACTAILKSHPVVVRCAVPPRLPKPACWDMVACVACRWAVIGEVVALYYLVTGCTANAVQAACITRHLRCLALEVRQTLKQEHIGSCYYNISLPLRIFRCCPPFPPSHLAWAALWLPKPPFCCPCLGVLRHDVSCPVVHRDANLTTAALPGALLRYSRPHTVDGHRVPACAL